MSSGGLHVMPVCGTLCSPPSVLNHPTCGWRPGRQRHGRPAPGPGPGRCAGLATALGTPGPSHSTYVPPQSQRTNPRTCVWSLLEALGVCGSKQGAEGWGDWCRGSCLPPAHPARCQPREAQPDPGKEPREVSTMNVGHPRVVTWRLAAAFRGLKMTKSLQNSQSELQGTGILSTL